MQAAIPTNIITGFLGVGKTTTIKHLLQHKPPHEVWSVLVNEFGEIGIDGAMLQGTNAHVREVPGGCICCVAGLPMKIALNMLVATTKPDRILIEPTGLGHPEDIIQTLTGEYYAELLDLRATLVLVDPRKLNDPRYANNANFQDQIAIADVLIANKMDLSTAADEQALAQLLSQIQPAKTASHRVVQGQVDSAWLDLARIIRPRKQLPTRTNRLEPIREPLHLSVTLPEGEDFIRRENSGQGFYSCGWLFRPDWVFDFNLLFLLLTGISATRVKAVMATNQGIYLFNSELGVLSVNPLEPLSPSEMLDSRLELINDQTISADELEQQLLLLILR